MANSDVRVEKFRSEDLTTAHRADPEAWPRPMTDHPSLSRPA